MLDFKTLKKRSKMVDCSFPQYKLAVLGDCATQHITTALKGTAVEDRLTLNIFEADYNQIYAQIADSGSELYEFDPESILIIMCTEKLLEAFQRTPVDSRAAFADSIIQTIKKYWDTLETNTKASIIQFNFFYYNDSVMGSYALREPSSFPFQLQKLNYLLSQAASEYKGVFLVDVHDIECTYGKSFSCDSKLYYIAKMPFSLEALPYLAKRTIDVIIAMRGAVKKCVILDLDNTLWGGVIGDDGLEGIEIGELGTGHAFTDFQCWLKELKRRGILLAVCSKNEENTAKIPFEKHPDMVLHLDDFVMFVANWEDKASNIIRIQQTLNIGMDSIVFIDDNPFEREQVRAMIPSITVPDIPQDPALYLDFLKTSNLFETVSFSNADAKRTAQYQEEASRNTMMSVYGSYDEYLGALEMQAVAAPFDSFNFPRIAQLTQRSNQFNLRTIRYTEKQVEDIATADDHITRYYTLKDKFGDYGLISVVILDKRADGDLFISEWLMSCRVLKRGMEEFIINDILSLAKENGSKQVIGEYIKTPKNAMVEDIYKRMGFEPREHYFYADVASFEYRITNIKGEEK